MSAPVRSTDKLTAEVLDHIVQSPRLESMWLNTLSLLEHVGASKIRRAVGDRHDRLDVLDHAADEARHALALKRQAQAIEPTEEYLAKDEALTYFSRLDHESNTWLDSQLGGPSTWRAYLVTTALIEQRALRLYPAYEERTTHEGVRRELKRLVGEEAKHRLMIESSAQELMAAVEQGWEQLLDREEGLFEVWMQAVSKTTGVEKSEPLRV
ncbi:MAG: ferritin-like domain-containing protein [Myxococcales bacterium]|nr:ferritin-like domain-containing protein [Myxococcales bacterium]